MRVTRQMLGQEAHICRLQRRLQWVLQGFPLVGVSNQRSSRSLFIYAPVCTWSSTWFGRSILPVGSAFWGKRATCGSHFRLETYLIFPLTKDDLHALAEVQKYVCRSFATLLPRYAKLSDRFSVPLIHRPWHWWSSFTYLLHMFRPFYMMNFGACSPMMSYVNIHIYHVFYVIYICVCMCVLSP